MNLKEDFSVILQQRGKPPKHYEVNKRKAKTFFILFPLSNIILFVSLGLIIVYFSTLKTQFLLEKPELIKNHENEKIILNKTITNLKIKNKNLSQELIFNDGVAFSGSQFIRVLPNSQDKTQEQLIAIDSKKVTTKKNNYFLNFNITNQSVVDRVSGYFFSIIKKRNTFQFYPRNMKFFKSISFKDGEYFSTSRFRPVQVSFPKLELSSELEVIILIYSKEGDLIHSSAENLEIINE
jgi:hypothetical protein